MVRHSIVKDEHLTFLDNLRSGGSVNMFGARPVLEEEFALNKEAAKEITCYWMKSFGDDKR